MSRVVHFVVFRFCSVHQTTIKRQFRRMITIHLIYCKMYIKMTAPILYKNVVFLYVPVYYTSGCYDNSIEH